jgi:hypothetical protein
VILEQESTITFAAGDLAGTWDLVGLEQESEPDGNVGRWVIGDLGVPGSGNISGGALVSPRFEGAPSGLLFLSNDSFICSGGLFCDGAISITGADSSVLAVHALMSADKNAIYGVHTRFTESEDEMRGLFTLVRRGAASSSTVQFAARTYTRTEGAGPRPSTSSVPARSRHLPPFAGNLFFGVGQT